jgi:hypothetical protein
MDLPDEKDHQMPQGFGCMYYREAEERIFSATVDGEHFTVTVLDEKGWDSDGSDKRDQNQVGIYLNVKSYLQKIKLAIIYGFSLTLSNLSTRHMTCCGSVLMYCGNFTFGRYSIYNEHKYRLLQYISFLNCK